jgi:Zn-dependent peptidase ImmA (M78 family)
MTRVICTQANPAVLVWARKNSGRDTDGIAKRLGITPEAYLEVEAGARHLTLSQLRNFSDLVKRPLATFYLSSLPQDVTKPKDYRSATGSLGREAMLSFRKAERVQELSTIPFAAESSLFRLRADMQIAPTTLAAKAREAVGLTEERQKQFSNSEEFTNWLVEVLAAIGVHVLFHGYPISDSKAYTLSGTPPVIVVNRRDFLNSQLFSLLHELCHLLLRKPGMCDTIGAGGGSTLETYCNRLASNFIIPTDWITKVIDGYDQNSLATDDALDKLARTFSTSRDVVLLKLVELGSVEASAYTRMRSRWEAMFLAKRKGGRTSIKSNALKDNGGLFISEIATAYAANQIGVVDAADLLGINPSYVEDVVGVPGGAG